MEKKSARQLYLMRILLEQTDESHALTLQELIEKMDAEGIPLSAGLYMRTSKPSGSSVWT